MKKFFTLSLMLLLGAASMMAQKNTDVQFVTVKLEGEDIVKTGDVADGAEIYVSTITESDGFLDAYIGTGLGVENTTDNGKRVQVDYEILKLDNGGVQCCFSTCKTYDALGTYYTPLLSQSGNRVNLPVVKKHEVADLAGEWFYGGDGIAIVKFTAMIGTRNESKEDAEGDVYDVVEGPSVTVHFLKGEAAAGINATESTDAVKTTYFDLSGRKVSAPVHGVYVKKTQSADGSIKTSKVAVK